MNERSPVALKKNQACLPPKQGPGMFSGRAHHLPQSIGAAIVMTPTADMAQGLRRCKMAGAHHTAPPTKSAARALARLTDCRACTSLASKSRPWARRRRMDCSMRAYLSWRCRSVSSRDKITCRQGPGSWVMKLPHGAIAREGLG